MTVALKLAASVSGVALCVCLSGTALAQDSVPTAPASSGKASANDAAPPGNAPALEDIVVTARKVSENGQRVPVAVTVYSGAALAQQGAAQVSDIAKLTPGLTITPNAANGSAAQFTIRGQVQSEYIATADPSVGLYVDGYYWARAYGINADLLDVQSVQTLRGPQGTLFGRNTTGGAILIQTNDPNFQGISGLLSGTYGRFNLRSGTAVLNLPIIDDRVALRVAYQRNDRDGYIDDPVSGWKLDNKHDYTIRAKLLIKPTDSVSVLISGEQYRTNYANDPYRLQYLAPSSIANLQAIADTQPPATTAACFASAAAMAACKTAGNALYRAAAVAANAGDTVAMNIPSTTYAKTRTLMGTVTVDTSFGAIKAVGGYRSVKSVADTDLDGSQYQIISTRLAQDLYQYSAELQMTGKLFRDRVDFAAGLFYFHEAGSDENYAATIPVVNPTIQHLFGRISNDSQGMYGQATFHVTDRLAATGGIRYSIDDKNLTSFNGVFSSGTYSSGAPGATFFCQIISCPLLTHASFKGISYQAGLDYRVTPDILVYIKTGRGFRSGGLNLRSSSFFPGSENPFKPEVATSHEAGIKSELLNRHLRLNLAGYYTKDEDIQRSTFYADSAGHSTTVIGNAGRADFYGGEAEAQFVILDGLQLTGTLGYTKPKYKSYIDPVSGFDRSHERFYGVPKWTASISPSYTHDFSIGKFLIRGDFSYQSKTALYSNGYYVDASGVTRNASNGSPIDPVSAAEMLRGSTDAAHWLINARTSLTVLDDRLDISVWGKNLSNRRDLVVALPIDGLGEVAGARREPRTFGVTATLKFGEK